MELSERVAAARSHFSHPSFIIGNWQPLGHDWPLLNQYISGYVVTVVFALILYYGLSIISYKIFYVWYKQKFTPRETQLKFQKETYFHDIKWSAINILVQAFLVTLVKMGYPYFSKVQYSFQLRPILLLYVLIHIVWDEFFTYWIHRILHHPKLYRHLHAIHHKSKAVTPFTGFAFHPIDAFSQALPVFTSCYFLPLPIDLVLFHALLTSVWAISIHDNVNLVPFKGILYAGSHSIHHFPWGQNYNYGKFTSVCDRLYGTYCDPEGITGYGYKIEKRPYQFYNKLNQWYTSLIPDNGLKIVSKVRNLYAKRMN